MLIDMIAAAGPWTWFILGFALLVGEALVPGIYLVWFGTSALVVGSASLLPFAAVNNWSWTSQIVVFAILSLLSVMLARKFFPTGVEGDDAGRMNDPLGRYVGREATLMEAMENGAGRVRIGDTTWRVRGVDAPAGTRVKVVGVEDGALTVTPL
ncbi:NfeD family protein [Ahrensia sp. R2A130]|uniref:NfeD family protein n=1 Tax=Ahrensia sp. R2A130 TaxID=744979 RepID=UPI0001E0C36E|nr:NfeD family protein [Ahrensia sp. R2A130]EFL88784.1 inner membrane protein YbbJ [Ahrensia sp. R2A130]